MTSMRTTTLTIIAALATNCALGGQEKGNDEFDQQDSRQLTGVHASLMRMVAVSDPDNPFELREQPLIHWMNSTRGGVFGGVYLWTHNDRPMAFAGIMCRLTETSIRGGHEFHSLTDLPLNVEYDGQQVWAPTAPGIEYHPLADSEPPAASAPIRLRQMKQIARQFSIDISSPHSETETLRVLPTPIYRYSEPDAGLIDGAIIAYSQGTDPEALLLVEAMSNAGKHEWRYAIARCTIWGVQARLNSQVVYDVPVVPQPETDMSAAYFNVRWMKGR